MLTERPSDRPESVVPTSWSSRASELLEIAAALSPGQLSDAVPVPVHAVGAEWPRDLRVLLLWLTRIRPSSRARHLELLSDFLTWSGIDSPSRALDITGADAVAMRQLVRKYIVEVDERRSQRLFAYSALRSFFARGHCPLPGDVTFDVGGTTSSWWVRSGRSVRTTAAEGIQHHGAE